MKNRCRNTPDCHLNLGTSCCMATTLTTRGGASGRAGGAPGLEGPQMGGRIGLQGSKPLSRLTRAGENLSTAVHQGHHQSLGNRWQTRWSISTDSTNMSGAPWRAKVKRMKKKSYKHPEVLPHAVHSPRASACPLHRALLWFNESAINAASAVASCSRL